jgi:PPOX class probable F420-dependent enzyme
MLSGQLKELILRPSFAVLTTIGRDGQPQSSVMWVDCDDEHLLFNTEVERAKFHNLTRDPRVTLLVWDKESPYRYVEVRGTVVDTVTGPEAERHLEELAERYTGAPFAGEIGSPRVIVRVRPTRTRVVA